MAAAAAVARGIRTASAVTSAAVFLVAPLLFTRQSPVQLSPPFVPASSRLTPVRCRVTFPCIGYQPYEFHHSDLEEEPLFPSGDNRHWLVLMHKPRGEDAVTGEKMIRCYLQTLAEVVGSEEEAERRIYKFSSEKYHLGFCCEIDEETSKKLKGLPCVLAVVPDPDPGYFHSGDEEAADCGLSWVRANLDQVSACMQELEMLGENFSGEDNDKGKGKFVIFDTRK